MSIKSKRNWGNKLNYESVVNVWKLKLKTKQQQNEEEKITKISFINICWFQKWA